MNKKNIWIVVGLIALVVLMQVKKDVKKTSIGPIIDNMEHNGYVNAYGNIWQAQSFVAPVDFQISSVEMRLGKAGLPPGAILDIREPDLLTILTSADLLGEEITIPITNKIVDLPPANFVAGNTYYLLIRTPDGNNENRIKISRSGLDPYPEGMRQRTLDGGETWVSVEEDDIAFIINGEQEISEGCIEEDACGSIGKCVNGECMVDKATYLGQITGEINYLGCTNNDNCCYEGGYWCFSPSDHITSYESGVGLIEIEVIDSQNPPPSTNNLNFYVNFVLGEYLPEAFALESLAAIDYGQPTEDPISYNAFQAFVIKYSAGQIDFENFYVNANGWVR